MTNADIASLLRNVAASYSVKDEKKYRFQIIAYQKAADGIASSTSEAKDLLRDDKLEDLPGVGPSIRHHIEELLKTGKVKHFEAVMKNIPPTMFPLLDIPSFGPKKAYRLVTEFHLNNPKTAIDDIEEFAKKGKIAPLDGFGEKSQADILRAISEFRAGAGKTTRMALPFAGELAEKLQKYLKESKYVIQAEPLGSLRRMKSTVGDIDFAVATHNPKEVIEHFINYPNKQRVIEKGEATAAILASSGTQVDLMTQTPQNFGALLQHFTGSKNHNIHLRELALKKGLSISEYGVKKVGSEKLQKYDSEEKFYGVLGLSWIPPEMREDTGEIELAVENKLPKIIELKDMKGDLHIHSNYPIEPSHDLGADSMEKMLLRAKELGYEYLGFSEHNPSVSRHTSRQMYDILARRKEKIEKLKASKKYIHIITLLELDILSNGRLAIDEKALSQVDAVLVSIHSSFSMSQRDMTKRIIHGLSHPKAKILSHPTGRMLNERNGYEVDFDQLFDFVKKHDKALEINAWPNRLDLPDSLVRQAVEKGVKMVIDTDSHALWQMDIMKYGVAVARRGWAKKSDILNTQPYVEFVKWIKE